MVSAPRSRGCGCPVMNGCDAACSLRDDRAIATNRQRAEGTRTHRGRTIVSGWAIGAVRAPPHPAFQREYHHDDGAPFLKGPMRPSHPGGLCPATCMTQESPSGNLHPRHRDRRSKIARPTTPISTHRLPGSMKYARSALTQHHPVNAPAASNRNTRLCTLHCSRNPESENRRLDRSGDGRGGEPSPVSIRRSSFRDLKQASREHLSHQVEPESPAESQAARRAQDSPPPERCDGHSLASYTSNTNMTGITPRPAERHEDRLLIESTRRQGYPSMGPFLKL